MMPSAAMPRPSQCGDDRHAMRMAMRPNANGSTRSEIQTGTPLAIMSPASRSLLTSATPPNAKSVATKLPIAPAMMCATLPIGPFGRNSPVASESSLPSRAAIAAPSNPTHIVRC